MANDEEARTAVRALMERFEIINSQRLGMAYVLANRDRDAYEKLLAEADQAIEMVIRPLIQNEAEHQKVYSALSDPNADWPAAILRMLNTTVRHEHRGQWKPTNGREGFEET